MSIALIGPGLDSAIEGLASVVYHLALHGQPDPLRRGRSEARRRAVLPARALRRVRVRALVDGDRPDETLVGIALACGRSCSCRCSASPSSASPTSSGPRRPRAKDVRTCSSSLPASCCITGGFSQAATRAPSRIEARWCSRLLHTPPFVGRPADRLGELLRYRADTGPLEQGRSGPRGEVLAATLERHVQRDRGSRVPCWRAHRAAAASRVSQSITAGLGADDTQPTFLFLRLEGR